MHVCPQVVQWCTERFDAEVADRSIPDAAVPLSKAALLIALEEEAAALLDPPARPVRAAAAQPRTSSGTATWSLSRLDALADEAFAHFAAMHGDDSAGGGGGGGAVPSSAAAAGAAARRWFQQQLQQQQQQDTKPGAGERARRLTDWVRSVALFGVNSLRQRANMIAAAASSSGQSRLTATPPPSPASSTLSSLLGPSTPFSSSSSSSSSSSPINSRADLVELIRRYPTAALGSVNAVLFDRQGYTACNRWGEAR